MPILLYPPAYCGLETFCRHPMTLGALPSNRIALGDWQAVNLFNLANFLHLKLCTIRQPILLGVTPVVIGLRNTTALSVILFQSAMSRPNRNLPNLYEL